jgi:hypothetical protein
MTCTELQESLAEVEDGSTAIQAAHLRSCPACSALVRELNLIVASAGELREADEPSPRVWNSIEIALRSEGLIRVQPARAHFLPSLIERWGFAGWLVPVAAVMILLATGIFVRQRLQPAELSQQASLAVPVSTLADLNDDDLMQEVSDNVPAMKAEFQENLQRVNQSIRDAQTFVDESPNDEDARRSLLDAYQQKSMLFELAMDRSLP